MSDVGYVVAGWVLTAVVLVAYWLSLVWRTRRRAAVGAVNPATKKRRAVVAMSLSAAAVVAIVALTVVLSNNVVYFRTVSEAVADRRSSGDDRFRMAGEVVPGSVEETPTGVRFDITDGKATAEVAHTGDPPGLFEDGAPVVCEGRWGAGAVFLSDRIMIRHGNEYTPPEVESNRALPPAAGPDAAA